MRRSTAIFAVLALAGCDEHTWERPGTTDVTRQGDRNDCRQQARSEAFRSHAYHSGFPIMGPAYWGFRYQPDYRSWRQRLDSEPVFYQNRLTNFCMRNKGYTLVRLEEGYRDAPSRSPGTTPSPGAPQAPPVNLPPTPPGTVAPR